MSEIFNKNIFNSIKIYNCSEIEHKIDNISITEDGYIFCVKFIVEKSLGYTYSYLKFEKDLKIIKGNGNIILSLIRDSDTLIYLTKDSSIENTNFFSFREIKYGNGKQERKFSFLSHPIEITSISNNQKFIILGDINQTLNVYCMEELKNIKSINVKNEDEDDEIVKLEISSDGKTIACFKNSKIIIIKENNITIIPFDYIYCTNMKVYFGNDNIIKIGFYNGSVLHIKNEKIISKTIRNLLVDRVFFSNDGKILCIERNNNCKFIHEDADEYSNDISLIKNVYNTYISPDNKLFLAKNKFEKVDIVAYDLSFIGYKKCQKLQFLTCINDKVSSIINSFSHNTLFDINVVKLIFNFLPFSRQVEQEDLIIKE